MPLFCKAGKDGLASRKVLVCINEGKVKDRLELCYGRSMYNINFKGYKPQSIPSVLCVGRDRLLRIRTKYSPVDGVGEGVVNFSRYV